jgi:hypothetical protein
LYFLGFSGVALDKKSIVRDKKSIVDGQKVDSLGTKCRCLNAYFTGEHGQKSGSLWTKIRGACGQKVDRVPPIRAGPFSLSAPAPGLLQSLILPTFSNVQPVTLRRDQS